MTVSWNRNRIINKDDVKLISTHRIVRKNEIKEIRKYRIERDEVKSAKGRRKKPPEMYFTESLDRYVYLDKAREAEYVSHMLALNHIRAIHVSDNHIKFIPRRSGLESLLGSGSRLVYVWREYPPSLVVDSIEDQDRNFRFEAHQSLGDGWYLKYVKTYI